MNSHQRDQKLKALRKEYSGWIPQHELDKLDGVPAQSAAIEAIAERFAPEQIDIEDAPVRKPRKSKVDAE